MPKTIVIGAGFSKALAEAPVTKELFEIIVQDAKTAKKRKNGWSRQAGNFLSILQKFNTKAEEFKKSRGHIDDIQKMDGFYLDNLEYLCTLIDLETQYSWKPKSTEVSTSHTIPWFLDLSKQELKQVVEFIKHHIFNCLLPENLKPSKELLEKFCDFLKPGDTIISFNYDLVLDQTLSQNCNWSPIDGYGFSQPIFDCKYKEPKKSDISLLKLHGSINWKVAPYKKGLTICLNHQTKDEPFFDTLEIQSRRRPIKKSNYTSNPAILPSFIKMYSEYWYSEIICSATESIKKSEEIWLLGYSLPDPDTISQFIISNANPNAKFLIINPEAESLKIKLRKKFGIGSDNIYSKDEIKQWIKTT